MEADEVIARIDSLWFYPSVFHLQPSSNNKQSKCPDEHDLSRPKQQQDSAATRGGSSETSCQAPRCAKEVTVVATEGEGRAVSRSCRESDERVHVWLKQRRRRKVVAMPAVRCSRVPVPPPDDDTAMKAHLRSWAHAVACSVR